MRVDVTMKGEAALVSSLGVAADALAEPTEALAEATEIAAAEARVRAPRRRGHLAASVRADAVAATGFLTAGGQQAPYAPPVHNGWIQNGTTHRGQPFLAAAIDTTEQKTLNVLETHVQREIDKVKGI